MTAVKKPSLTDNLKKLRSIVEWFERQEDVDIETGIAKVREGAGIIKESRSRLRELENEFTEIKKDLAKAKSDD